jgi:hypothetical protein
MASMDCTNHEMSTCSGGLTQLRLVYVAVVLHVLLLCSVGSAWKRAFESAHRTLRFP